ncbi:unnamed protein product [Caenorhabditis brenneri]
MQNSFPLFNLPYVALSLTTRMLIPTELTYLALSSRKTYKMVKRLRIRNPNISLEVSCSMHSSITVDTENEKSFTVFLVAREKEIGYSDGSILYLNFEKSVIPVKKTERGNLEVFWGDDTFPAIQKLSEFVSELFEIPIKKLYLSNENYKNDPKRIIDWLNSREETLEDCNFECCNTNSTELKYFLDNLKITKKLYLGVETTDDFRYNFRNPFEIDSVEIPDAKWPTIENLNQLNSRQLDMTETEFTNQEVNEFLKNWIGGMNSRLQFLHIGTELINTGQITNGIEVTRREHPDRVQYFYGDESPISFRYSIDITNDAGKIASIIHDDRVDDEEFEFMMLAWPDWNGNEYSI